MSANNININKNALPLLERWLETRTNTQSLHRTSCMHRGITLMDGSALHCAFDGLSRRYDPGSKPRHVAQVGPDTTALLYTERKAALQNRQDP